MILSDAIILDVEDARQLSKAIGTIYYDRKARKLLLPEHLGVYSKLKELIDEIDSRKRVLDDMADSIRDIQRTLHPDQQAD
jgi:hypothetical protein